MRGPNPFTPWEQDPANIFGRKEESRIFKAFVSAAAAKQGGVMLIHGGPGSGKTSLLRYFQLMAEKEGMLVPFVKAERGEDEAALAAKIYQELAILPTFRGKEAPGSFMELALGAESFGQFGAVFFIDDMDDMRKADDALAAITEAAASAWGKKRISFVLSATRGFRAESDLVGIMELGPLTEHDAHELIEKALGKGPPRMGDECLNSVIADSAGNPRLFKGICRHIFDRLRDNEKVISKGHYLAYQPHIMSMLSREWFGRMYQATPEAEREILKVLSKSAEGMHVSDIARELDKPLGPVTALTKRLLDRGQITKLGRGKYAVFARLYAKYIQQRG